MCRAGGGKESTAPGTFKGCTHAGEPLYARKYTLSLYSEGKRDSIMTYAEKLKQANREARAAVIGLVATVIVWALLGFGVAASGIVVFSTPLWIITGCFGTFAFAIVVAVVMAKVVMRDVNLDEEEKEGEADAR